ncbi:hypothetical protein AMECASPLE_035737 [Ameca splendens]|uniref:Uncharacterized protein n=1 Tax=Ameca splendens TaxID=208324 RepID=A0ABV0YII9_9TELE
MSKYFWQHSVYGTTHSENLWLQREVKCGRIPDGWRLFGGSAVIMEHGEKTHSQSSDVSSTRQIRLRNSCGSKAGGGNMYRTFFSVTSCERQQVVQNNLLVITSLPEQNIQHIPHDQHMNIGCRFVRLKFIYG